MPLISIFLDKLHEHNTLHGLSYDLINTLTKYPWYPSLGDHNNLVAWGGSAVDNYKRLTAAHNQYII